VHILQFCVYIFYFYTNYHYFFIISGQVHQDLLNFLESFLPKKKKKVLLGVADSRLAVSITEAFQSVLRCTFATVVQEILRGVRTHFHLLARDLPHASLNKAQLSLGHSYSRAKVFLL
jgi:nucleolar protein 56